MNEIKRIFGNRRILFRLVLIILLNGFLFVREQNARDFGMDCSLPQMGTAISFDDGGYDMQTEKADAKAVLSRYRAWLEKVGKMSLPDAVSALEQEKDRLEQLLKNENHPSDSKKTDYAAVNTLLSQAKSLTDYPDWLDSIQKNKDSMMSFSIFSDPDSFSGRNILKTADEFIKLEGVSLKLGADGAIQSLLDFSLTDYFLLIVLMIIAVSFLEERKKGLWNVVHAAPGGRLHLAAHRTAILFFTSVFGVLLLYGTNLAIGFTIYGGLNDLGRSAQSVGTLGGLPIVCTVGQFLLQYFLSRIVAAFFVGLLLWMLVSAIRNVKYTLIFAGSLLALEYSLYTFLPVQSGFNLFKYFNLFTYISMSDLYTNYLNIDLFGYPFGIRSISQAALIPLCVLSATVCIIIHCKKKPSNEKDIFARLSYRLNKITDILLRQLRLFGFEIYKTAWIQKGVVIAILFLYLLHGLSFTAPVPVSNATDGAARQYTAELAGKITEDSFDRIDSIQAGLNQTIADYEKAKSLYEKGEIEYLQFDVFAREASAAQIKSEGLEKVRDRVNQLWEKGEKDGFSPYLIAETTFESVYGTVAKNNQQAAAMVELLVIGLFLAGSMVYEKQSGITNLLAATNKGREVLLNRKILLAVLSVVFVWAITYGAEFHTFLSICKTEALSASVQNLSMLEPLPLRCSIGMFLILLYAFRLLALLSAAFLSLLVSANAKRMETAYIGICGVLLLPSLLYSYVGLEPMKYMSLSVPLAAMPIIQTANPLLTICVISVCLGIVIGVSVYMLRKQWPFVAG